MLNLTKPPGQIGPSINVRTEKHGEEDVPACDVTIDGIMLEAADLCALLEDPKAHTLLFTVDLTGTVSPAFPQFAALTLAEKFEEARVVLYVGFAPTELVLKDVKVGKIRLTPKVGGMTECKLQIQATPEPEMIGVLSGHTNHEISIEIADAKRAAKAEKSKQKELNLSTAPDEPDAGTAETRSSEPPLTHPSQLFKTPGGRTRKPPPPAAVN